MKARLILLFMAVYMLFRSIFHYTCCDITNKFNASPTSWKARAIIDAYLEPYDRSTFQGVLYLKHKILYSLHPVKFKLWRSYMLLRLALLGK
jgi:hypothetical protein